MANQPEEVYNLCSDDESNVPVGQKRKEQGGLAAAFNATKALQAWLLGSCLPDNPLKCLNLTADQQKSFKQAVKFLLQNDARVGKMGEAGVTLWVNLLEYVLVIHTHKEKGWDLTDIVDKVHNHCVLKEYIEEEHDNEERPPKAAKASGANASKAKAPAKPPVNKAKAPAKAPVNVDKADKAPSEAGKAQPQVQKRQAAVAEEANMFGKAYTDMPPELVKFWMAFQQQKEKQPDPAANAQQPAPAANAQPRVTILKPVSIKNKPIEEQRPQVVNAVVADKANEVLLGQLPQANVINKPKDKTVVSDKDNEGLLGALVDKAKPKRTVAMVTPKNMEDMLKATSQILQFNLLPLHAANVAAINVVLMNLKKTEITKTKLANTIFRKTGNSVANRVIFYCLFDGSLDQGFIKKKVDAALAKAARKNSGKDDGEDECDNDDDECDDDEDDYSDI